MYTAQHAALLLLSIFDFIIAFSYYFTCVCVCVFWLEGGRWGMEMLLKTCRTYNGNDMRPGGAMRKSPVVTRCQLLLHLTVRGWLFIHMSVQMVKGTPVDVIPNKLWILLLIAALN